MAHTKDSELVLTALEPEYAFTASKKSPIDWSGIETFKIGEVDP